MTYLDRAEGFIGSFWAALGVGVASAVIWVIRTVFTNHKKLDQLQAEIRLREEHREIERDTIRRIETDLREVKSDVKHLFQNNHTGGAPYSEN